MEPIDFVRSKIKSAGVRTASLVSRCENIDKNKDGIVHFDDIDHILSELMGKKDQLTRREVNCLRMVLSNAPERGEVVYKRLYDILDAKKKDTGSGEIWIETEEPGTGAWTGTGTRGRELGLLTHTINDTRFALSRRGNTIGRGRRCGSAERVNSYIDRPHPCHDENESSISNNADMYYVPRGSLGDFLHKRDGKSSASGGDSSSNGEQTSNFKKFIHALEKYERDSGMTIEDSPRGFLVPLGRDLCVNIEFRGLL